MSSLLSLVKYIARCWHPCRRLVWLLPLALVCACNNTPSAASASPTNNVAASDDLPAEIQVLRDAVHDPLHPLPVYTYQIVNTYPHRRDAFTEGLFYLNGSLYESTGLNGQSSLRRVELTTGTVQQQTNLSAKYFGEGLAALNGRLYQLTWQTRLGFVYDLATFQHLTNFTYSCEGWGLTTDGKSLIESDGTDILRFFDPVSFTERRKIHVNVSGQPIRNLNELEYVQGELYANLWRTELVARIDPATGNLLGIIDFSGILPPADQQPPLDVMNGIAYDSATDRLFVTGKFWPKLYEVKIVPR